MENTNNESIPPHVYAMLWKEVQFYFGNVDITEVVDALTASIQDVVCNRMEGDNSMPYYRYDVMSDRTFVLLQTLRFVSRMRECEIMSEWFDA